MNDTRAKPPGLIRFATLRTPTSMDVARLMTVSALWGGAFLCNEIALRDFEPVAIAGWRILLATLIILPVCHRLGLRIPTDRHSLGLFVAIGWLNSAVPFSLIGWGQQQVDSATTAILIACSPFATLVLSNLMTPDERFSLRRLAGLLLGFSGVLVLLGHDVLAARGTLPGMLAILLAACCYAVSGLLIRRLGGVQSLVVVGATLLASTLVLVPILLWHYPPWQQSVQPASMGALLILATGPTALAYVLRTRIVQANGAVFMSNAGYLIPLFAVFWAWLLLGRVPAPQLWLALALILAGIALGRTRG